MPVERSECLSGKQGLGLFPPALLPPAPSLRMFHSLSWPPLLRPAARTSSTPPSWHQRCPTLTCMHHLYTVHSSSLIPPSACLPIACTALRLNFTPLPTSARCDSGLMRFQKQSASQRVHSQRCRSKQRRLSHFLCPCSATRSTDRPLVSFRTSTTLPSPSQSNVFPIPAVSARPGFHASQSFHFRGCLHDFAVCHLHFFLHVYEPGTPPALPHFMDEQLSSPTFA